MKLVDTLLTINQFICDSYTSGMSGDIRTSLIAFLKSLEVKNKEQLECDINLYGLCPESMAAAFLAGYAEEDAILAAFSHRYNHAFSKEEKERMSKLLKKTKAKIAVPVVPYYVGIGR